MNLFSFMAVLDEGIVRVSSNVHLSKVAYLLSHELEYIRIGVIQLLFMGGVPTASAANKSVT